MGGVEVGHAGAVDGCGHVGEQEGEPLVLDDRDSEGLPVLCILGGLVEGALGQSCGHGRDPEPAAVQGTEGMRMPCPGWPIWAAASSSAAS